MGLSPAGLIADAWWAFRRDRELLLAIAGAFWFLPTFALVLLVPAPPLLKAAVEPGSPEAAAYVAQLMAWAGSAGGWYLLRGVIDAWATAIVYALYLDRTQPDLRAALGVGLRAWPRLMLLGALVGAPVAVPALTGQALFILPCIWVFARLIAAGPALVAERPLGVLAAVGRGFRLSRGAGLPLMGTVGITLAIGWLGSQPFRLLDGWLRARPGGPNLVAVATVDALAAAGETAAAIASALLAIAAYRRLASIGT